MENILLIYLQLNFTPNTYLGCYGLNFQENACKFLNDKFSKNFGKSCLNCIIIVNGVKNLDLNNTGLILTYKKIKTKFAPKNSVLWRGINMLTKLAVARSKNEKRYLVVSRLGNPWLGVDWLGVQTARLVAARCYGSKHAEWRSPGKRKLWGRGRRGEGTTGCLFIKQVTGPFIIYS